MGRNRDATKTDFSSFMCIILMLTGCLITIMVSNVMIIAANPENVSISSVIRSHTFIEGVKEEIDLTGTLFPTGNKDKTASFIDVYRDRIVLYPGEVEVPLSDLEAEGNPFEKLVAEVAASKTNRYVILLVRPYSSSVSRRLKKFIHDQGIDVGFELFEKGRPVEYGKKVSSTSL